MAFCYGPEDADRTDVNGVTVTGRQYSGYRAVIMAQCCTTSGTCRRRWPGNSNSDCVAGISGSSSQQPFTWSENKEWCETRGLTLCSKSCSGTGCSYNRHPVYTGILCAPLPSDNPPPPPSPPLPSPPPLPPPPTIPHSDWVDNPALSPITFTAGSEAEYFNQCKNRCEDAVGSACLGFLSSQSCGTGGDETCCRFHTATDPFFTPAAHVYIKTTYPIGSNKASKAKASSRYSKPEPSPAPVPADLREAEEAANQIPQASSGNKAVSGSNAASRGAVNYDDEEDGYAVGFFTVIFFILGLAAGMAYGKVSRNSK